jgi:predicted RNA methylase
LDTPGRAFVSGHLIESVFCTELDATTERVKDVGAGAGALRCTGRMVGRRTVGSSSVHDGMTTFVDKAR